MKILKITFAALAIFSATSCKAQSGNNDGVAGKSAVDISGLKALRQEMNYSEARKIIIDAGWQGNSKRWQDAPDFGQEKSVYYNNWTEVVSCTGAGVALCRFEFNDVRGNTLVVITAGECLNENSEHLEEGKKCDLNVDKWFLEQVNVLHDVNNPPTSHPTNER